MEIYYWIWQIFGRDFLIQWTFLAYTARKRVGRILKAGSKWSLHRHKENWGIIKGQSTENHIVNKIQSWPARSEPTILRKLLPGDHTMAGPLATETLLNACQRGKEDLSRREQKIFKLQKGQRLEVNVHSLHSNTIWSRGKEAFSALSCNRCHSPAEF